LLRSLPGLNTVFLYLDVKYWCTGINKSFSVAKSSRSALYNSGRMRTVHNVGMLNYLLTLSYGVWSAANSSASSCVIAKIAHWCYLPLRSKHGRMITWVFQGGSFGG